MSIPSPYCTMNYILSEQKCFNELAFLGWIKICLELERGICLEVFICTWDFNP